MPSPFPGIDPYLEGPRWESFHFAFSMEIARQLAVKLRGKYIVAPNDRFKAGEVQGAEEVSISFSQSMPDVSITRGREDDGRSTATAVLEPPFTARLPEPEEEPVELTVEIR